MTTTTDVLRSITVETTVDVEKLAHAIEALADSERTTTACAAAMATAEGGMASAVRADLDTVDITHAARQTLTRGGADARVLRGLLEATAAACERSAEECGRHADHHEHCALCSQGNQASAAACRALLEDLAS